MNTEIIMLIVGIISIVSIIVMLIVLLILYGKMKRFILNESLRCKEILLTEITEAINNFVVDIKCTTEQGITELNRTSSSLNKSFGKFEASQNDNAQKIYESISVSCREIIAEIAIKFMQFQGTVMLHDNALEVKNNRWILEKNHIEKIFTPGKLQEVRNGITVTRYEYHEDEIIATTIEENKEKVQISFSPFGAPKKGKIFDKGGRLLQEFIYNELGQVREVREWDYFEIFMKKQRVHWV